MGGFSFTLGHQRVPGAAAVQGQVEPLPPPRPLLLQLLVRSDVAQAAAVVQVHVAPAVAATPTDADHSLS